MGYEDSSLPKLHQRLLHLRRALEEIASIRLDDDGASREQAQKMQSVARKAIEAEPRA